MSTESATTHRSTYPQTHVLELEERIRELERENARLLASRDENAAAGERVLHTELFEAALRTVPIAMAIIDADLRYIRVNVACAAMTGVPVEAHPGRLLRDVNPRLSPELEAIMREVLATGNPCLNYRLTRPTPHAPGGAIEIVMHITAFHDAGGAIAGICSTATDMTAWKRLQEQFFQAQKLEAVGKLAAGVAHDFNNLVTIIGSYCDLVLMDLPPVLPPREEVEEIRRAARRATALARRMLGTARSSAVVAAPVDVRATVLEAAHMLRHATAPRAQLDVSCADERGIVLADATQIEQVLLNLVINAVDAMPNGGTVSVRTRNFMLVRSQITRVGEIAAGSYVEVTVGDTGIGMDDDTLSRIFEPFFTTKPRGKGTGLGLATVLGIVRELGGGVDVTSAPNAGTTFRILLPLLDEEAIAARRTPVIAIAAISERMETVLVVKAEDVVRAGLARILVRQGYRVLEAGHVGEAMRMLATHYDIALILTDLDLPGVTGMEFSDRVRTLGRPIPMLFMAETEESGQASRVPRTSDGSESHVLHAPFAIETLLTTMRETLADRSATLR